MKHRIRRLLSALLSLVLLVSLLPSQALAVPASDEAPALKEAEVAPGTEPELMPMAPEEDVPAPPEPERLTPTEPQADQVSGDYRFTVSAGNATITGYTGPGGDVVIPAVLDGYPVTAIGESAFQSCTSLVSIELPDSVLSVGNDAFRSCSALQSAYLGASLTSLGSHAFSDCTALVSVSIPASLTEVPFPYYGPFDNCNLLDSVSFGVGISLIPAHLFQKCGGLTHIELPDSVLSVGNDAFSYCSALQSADLGASLTSLGSHAFSNCTALVSVSIPASLTEVPFPYYGPFDNCNLLDSVSFGVGISLIPAHLFQKCGGLTHIELPDTVTKIGESAFRSCEKLQKAWISNPICTVGSSAFSNCPELTIYCAANALAVMYAMDNLIPLELTGDLAELDSSVLDWDKTGLFADVAGMSANGYIALTLRCGIKSAWISRVTQPVVQLRIPDSMILDEDSIRLDGLPCSNYTLSNKLLRIPLDQPEATIRLCVKVVQQGAILSYASLSMRKDGAKTEELIGFVNQRIPLLTLETPGETAAAVIHVSGIAPASATVSLSVDGKERGSAQASKAGMWSADLSLGTVEDMHRYVITAACRKEGVASQPVEVVYRETAVTLTEFVMDYGGTYDLLHTNGIKPLVYFSSGREIRFQVGFDHPEQIRNVYVVSTRNGEKKSLEASFDPDSQRFVTQGYFDPENHGYVPGNISVEYSKQSPEVFVDQCPDLAALASDAGWNASRAVTVQAQSDYDYQATVALSRLFKDLGNASVNTAISIYDAETHGNLGDWVDAFHDTEKIASYILKKSNGEECELRFDYSDPYNYVVLAHDISSNSFVKMALNAATENAEFGSEQFLRLTDFSNTLSHVSLVTKLMIDQYEISREADELRDRVLTNPRLSAEERAAVLQKVDEYEFDRSAFALLTTVLPLIVASPVGMGAAMSSAPMLLFMAIMGTMVACSGFIWDMRSAEFTSEKVQVRWCVDPSGYVYNAESLDRLADVTATAYWIPYDGSADFWQRVPSETEYGTRWDAAEYNQNNPLLTNVDGCYAWDVPEGWWRVHYERPDYDSVWSDWMTVPPLQTEVNIGMLTPGQRNFPVKLLERTSDSATLRLSNQSSKPTQLSFYTAVYNADGQMLNCSSESALLQRGEVLDLCVDCPVEGSATTIRAFVLDGDNVPLRIEWKQDIGS